MADRTNTDMQILEFLSVIKPSRRREVKERLDALTKYDYSEFGARFRLSKLTVHHLLSDVCHTSSHSFTSRVVCLASLRSKIPELACQYLYDPPFLFTSSALDLSKSPVQV